MTETERLEEAWHTAFLIVFKLHKEKSDAMDMALADWCCDALEILNLKLRQRPPSPLWNEIRSLVIDHVGIDELPNWLPKTPTCS